MKEIGSEFWDVPISTSCNKVFPRQAGWFLSGSSALQAIIKELKCVQTVALPSWCCHTMIKPFVDAGMEVSFYPVYFDNGLVQEINCNTDVLFLMDYFGYTAKQPDLSNYKGIIIRDVTHSIFSSSYSDADYYFGSLRKWCGIYTGGYAWAKDGHSLKVEATDNLGYASLREKAMHLKKCYITGCLDEKGQKVTDKGYLKLYEEAEDILDSIGIVNGDERDIWSANHLDVAFIKSHRRANAEVLRKAFSDILIFSEMKDTDCPLFVPILIPEGRRDELRRYLISKDIYCPVHWPISELHRLDDKTRYLYEDELSLVCDQRYDTDDMRRIADAIKEFYR